MRQIFLGAAIFPRKYGRSVILERPYTLGNFAAATIFPGDEISCDTTTAMAVRRWQSVVNMFNRYLTWSRFKPTWHINHNFTLTRVHLLLQCSHSLHTGCAFVLSNGLPVKHIHHWLPMSYCSKSSWLKLIPQRILSLQKVFQFFVIAEIVSKALELKVC